MIGLRGLALRELAALHGVDGSRGSLLGSLGG